MYGPAEQYVSQTGSLRRPLAMWLLIATGCAFVMLFIIAAPLALAGGHEQIAYNIYLPFSYLCHQIPARSFFIAQHPFAVCSRCTGIYAGFFVATLLYPVVRSLRDTRTPARKWLFVAAAPLAIDFAVEFFGVANNTHLSRFVTGALLGAVAVFYVLPGLLELALRDKKREDRIQSTTTGATTNAFATNPSPAPSDYSAPHRRI